VAAQECDSSSILTLYRSLLALRRSHDALSIGEFTLVDAAEGVLAYQRQHAGECLLIALNLSDQSRPLPQFPSLPKDPCVVEVLASTLWPSNLADRPMDGALAPD